MVQGAQRIRGIFILLRSIFPPNGDIDFFLEFIRESKQFQSFWALGDFNCHLSSVVEHETLCNCRHCALSTSDKAIEELFRQHDFICHNEPNKPTYRKDTIIDMIVSSSDLSPRACKTHPVGDVGNSDHAAVGCEACFSIPLNICISYHRVAWTSEPEWEITLQVLDPIFEYLATIVAALAFTPSILNMVESSRQVARRRRLMDIIVWLRETWYNLAGHLGGHVKVLASGSDRKQIQSSEDAWRLHNEQSHYHFRTWLQYLVLRTSNAGAADKLLSHMLRQDSQFRICIKDPDTGESLEDTEMVELMADEFFHQASQAMASDLDYRDWMQRTVSQIRHSGAMYDPEEDKRVTGFFFSPFTMAEMNTVLKTLCPSKQSFRGAYAAVRASGPGGRKLILCIANSSLVWCVSATSLSQRQCGPLHKSGPRVVTRIACLRPVSQGCDHSAVLDGLIIIRFGIQLQNYWGPDQYGGCFEAQAPVLAVVILSELRAGAGLDLILNFMDQIHGYDVVPKGDIRLGLFRAGVRGNLWLLLGDQLRNDLVRLAYTFLTSKWIYPSAGIGQGRKISPFEFNTAARFYRDEVHASTTGVGVPGSQMQRLLLNISETFQAASLGDIDQGEIGLLLPALRSMSCDIRGAACVLSQLSSAATRKVAVDTYCSERVVCIQYSDDNLVPASSWQQARHVWCCNEQYTKKHGPRFHVGSGKSACMRMHATPLPGENFVPEYRGMHVDVPTVHEYLGVLIDSGCSFEAHHKKSCGKLRTTFDKVFQAARSRGLPHVFIASIVPQRVEGAGLYGAALCLHVHGIERSFDQLQVSWAKRILGFEGFPQGV